LKIKSLLAFIVVFLSLSVLPRHAVAGQTLSVDVSAGVPHLLSFELAYLGLGPVVVGVGFGSLPVNSVLQRSIPMDNRAISGGYTLLPSGNYSFLTVSAFLRWFPLAKDKADGMFLELNVARWKFTSNVTGDLRNDSSGAVIGNALSGTIDFQQPMATLGIGYKYSIGSSFFLQGAVGATYLFTPSHTTVIGGSIEQVVPLANQSTIDSFEQAKADVNAQVERGVGTLQSTTKIIPALWLGMGWAF
jgi:hypothetical protein